MNSTTSTSTTALSVGDVLRYGNIEYLKGEIVAVGNKQYVVKNSFDDFFLLTKDGLKDKDGGAWHKVEPETVTYVNVYTDGLGETEHQTRAAAFHNTKYGRIRVGIMRKVKRGFSLVDASLEQTTPTLRTAFSDPHNPFA